MTPLLFAQKYPSSLVKMILTLYIIIPFLVFIEDGGGLNETT